jgi:enoyl-CoA hydratase/carnithine racemase
VAVLRLEHPARRNAVTLGMWRELPAALRAACLPTTRSLVIHGAGGDFSAGADISEFQDLRGAEAAEHYSTAVAEASGAIAAAPVPTIAAIDGYCVGGGCEIAVACDLRVAGEDARIGITAAKLGVVYNLVATRRLAALVGAGWTRYLLLTAALLPAERALAIGLVHEVHRTGPGESVLPAALALAERVAGMAAISVRGTRRVLELIGAGATGENEVTAALYAESYDSPEYRERVRAFLDRRDPN